MSADGPPGGAARQAQGPRGRGGSSGGPPRRGPGRRQGPRGRGQQAHGGVVRALPAWNPFAPEALRFVPNMFEEAGGPARARRARCGLRRRGDVVGCCPGVVMVQNASGFRRVSAARCSILRLSSTVSGRFPRFCLDSDAFWNSHPGIPRKGPKPRRILDHPGAPPPPSPPRWECWRWQVRRRPLARLPPRSQWRWRGQGRRRGPSPSEAQARCGLPTWEPPRVCIQKCAGAGQARFPGNPAVPFPEVPPLVPPWRPSLPGVAHKGGNKQTPRGTQRRNQALVCDNVLRKSGPCVRNQGGGGPPAWTRRTGRASGQADVAQAQRVEVGEALCPDALLRAGGPVDDDGDGDDLRARLAQR